MGHITRKADNICLGNESGNQKEGDRLGEIHVDGTGKTNLQPVRY